MINPNFVYLGVLIQFIGGYDYLYQTIKGTVKPNRVTWFLWALAPMIAFFAQLSKGVGVQSLMTFATGFVPLLIFLASFVNKKSEWKLGKFDLICGAFSLLGIFLWLITKEPNLAILFSIIADGLAAAPTVIKSYKFPETESHWVFTVGSISAALTLLSIETWTFEIYAFPLYIFIVNTLLVILIKFKIGKKK